MNKIYLVYGDESYLIDNFINDIFEEHKKYEKIEYDANEANISEVLDELNTISLFSTESKLVVCKNCYFLTGIKCDIDHKVDELIKYVDSDNDNILILSLLGENIDKRKKIVKLLENKAIIKHFEKIKPGEIKKFVRDYCKDNGYRIEEEALNLFLESLNDNLNIIVNELEKFFIFKKV